MIILDIETRTDMETLRLVGVKRITEDSSDVAYFQDDQMGLLQSYINKSDDLIITWNGTSFDLPILKTYDVSIPEEKHRDGMVLSQMLFPYRAKHSLDSWAESLDPTFRKHTIDYDESSITELATYLKRDLDITEKVWKHLSVCAAVTKGRWRKPLRVEQKVRQLVDEQGKRGFRFDTDRAGELADHLTSEMRELERKAESLMPSAPIPKSKLHHPPKVQFKTDGTASEYLKRYAKKYDYYLTWVDGKRCLKHKTTGSVRYLPLTEPLLTEDKMRLGDTARLKEYLLKHEWEPMYWNWKKVDGKPTKASPRLTDPVTKDPCPNIKKVSGVPVKEISEFLMLQSRLKLLQSSETRGLIPEAIEGGGYIHHSANTLGTPTARYTHRKIVNIPRTTSAYGEEIRSLFTADPGKMMVGWDATALESVIEAHYTYRYDPDYSKALVAGKSSDGTDIHTRNMVSVGLGDRDAAKKFKYAITYGAGPAKLGREFHWDMDTARYKYDQFWKANEGLAKLKEALIEEWEGNKKRYITGIDERKIFVNSPHLLLNYLFQSGGAILMKYASLIAQGLIKKEGLDARALIRYHDEEQWSADPSDALEVGRLGVRSIELAGQHLGLKVPITGEWKVGTNWAETH